MLTKSAIISVLLWQARKHLKTFCKIGLILMCLLWYCFCFCAVFQKDKVSRTVSFASVLYYIPFVPCGSTKVSLILCLIWRVKILQCVSGERARARQHTLAGNLYMQCLRFWLVKSNGTHQKVVKINHKLVGGLQRYGRSMLNSYHRWRVRTVARFSSENLEKTYIAFSLVTVKEYRRK